MTTLQEQFEKDFPDKSVREINASDDSGKYKNSNFTNYDLDLRGYEKSERLRLGSNNLTSVDFLNHLPNPEKLEVLAVFNNNIQPTDISIFSKFVNLERLKIGSMKASIVSKGKLNKFYGSLKSWKNLTKLESICIEATDVNEGLEYLPESLAKRTRGGIDPHFSSFECLPHISEAKVKAIQDQLRPFNYDLEAWQLAHPEKMLISRPELFTDPDSKDKWLKALTDKITNSQNELKGVKEQEADKIKKTTRLESKIAELETAKETISQQTQTEFQTQDQGTQTDLSGSDYEQQQKENQELKEQIKKLEEENNKTWYQKVIDKFKNH